MSSITKMPARRSAAITESSTSSVRWFLYDPHAPPTSGLSITQCAPSGSRTALKPLSTRNLTYLSTELAFL